MTAIEFPVALPWIAFALSWLAFGCLSCAAHALGRRRLARIEAGQRSWILLWLAILPAISALLVVLLSFAPRVGGLVVDGHCHAATGCAPHVPILATDAPHALLLFVGLAVVTATAVGSLFRRLSQSVEFSRVLQAMSVATSRDQRSSAYPADPPGGTPAFGVIETSQRFACCTGLFRPRILISRGLIETLSPAALRAVLAHERAHGRRLDNLRRLLAVACLWPVPKAWRRSLFADLALAAEIVCDCTAARASGSATIVIDAIRAMGPTQAAAAPAAGAPFRQALQGDGTVAARTRALLGEPASRLSGVVVAALIVAACAALILPAVSLTHHSAEVALGWLG